MTDIVELMQKRMTLVERLAALNSKQLQNTQTRAGIEVELLTCIETIERNGETEATLFARAKLEARYRTATDACAASERELDALAEELTNLDLQIEQLAGPAA